MNVLQLYNIWTQYLLLRTISRIFVIKAKFKNLIISLLHALILYLTWLITKERTVWGKLPVANRTSKNQFRGLDFVQWNFLSPRSRDTKGRYFVNLSETRFVRRCLFVRARDSANLRREIYDPRPKSHNKTLRGGISDARVFPPHLPAHFSPFSPVQIAQWTDRPAGGQFVWMDNDSPRRAQWFCCQPHKSAATRDAEGNDRYTKLAKCDIDA